MEVNPKNGYYSLGLQTCKVPMSLFDKNRKRLAAALKDNVGTPANSVVLLQAGGEQGIISLMSNISFNFSLALLCLNNYC